MHACRIGCVSLPENGSFPSNSNCNAQNEEMNKRTKYVALFRLDKWNLNMMTEIKIFIYILQLEEEEKISLNGNINLFRK